MVTSQQYQSMTVAELIKSLAQTEDALRGCPKRQSDGSENPTRRHLLQQQNAICSGLRRRRLEMARQKTH